jgi:hypothetical protein
MASAIQRGAVAVHQRARTPRGRAAAPQSLDGEQVKLLAIMRPREGVGVERLIAPHAQAELLALWQLYRDGVVREMHSPGEPGAVLVLEADSVKDAQRLLSGLPLLANEIMSLDLIQLHPFAALQMLFSGRPQT